MRKFRKQVPNKTSPDLAFFLLFGNARCLFLPSLRSRLVQGGSPIVKVQANLLLLLTSVIWGFGFIAQRLGMDHIGPYSFNVFRFLLGALSLVPLVYFLGRKKTGVSKAGKPFWIIGGLAGLVVLDGLEGAEQVEQASGRRPNIDTLRTSFSCASFFAWTCFFLPTFLDRLPISGHQLSRSPRRHEKSHC